MIELPKKGYKQTEEHKQNESKAHKGHKGHLAWNKGKPWSELAKSKMSLARIGLKLGEEVKKKISEAHKGKALSEQCRKNLSYALKGHEVSEKTKEKISLATKGRIAWNRGIPMDENTKRKLSIAKKGKQITEEHLKNILKGNNIKPNKAERQLDVLLNYYLPNEYRYVGNGDFILGGKCPDFLNVNGKKKLIELYGDYWHRNHNPQNRIAHFKKFGFDTLIIWGHELKNSLELIPKLLEFNER